MKITIEEAISHLYTYSSTMGSGQTTQEQHEDAKRVAIDIMRKYQKIEQILHNGFGKGVYAVFDEIVKVVKDGHND